MKRPSRAGGPAGRACLALGLAALACLPSHPDLRGKRCTQTPDCQGQGLECVEGACGVAAELGLALVGPVELPLGLASPVLRLQRRWADGGAAGAGLEATRVDLEVGTLDGQLSVDGKTWGPQLTVATAAGASQSDPFYYRSGTSGPAQLAWDAGAPGQAGLLPLQVSTLGLVSDFESGTLLTTESPAGSWQNPFLFQPGYSLSASPAAAHRGGFGFRLVDANADPAAAGNQAALDEDFLPARQDYYVRMWARLAQSNDQGSFVLVHVYGPGDPVGLYVQNPGGLLVISGTYQRLNVSLDPGVWHLVELSAQGMGSIYGERHACVDGVLRASQISLDWKSTTVEVNQVQVGEPWSDDNHFAGTIDLDDIRTSSVPPASLLGVTPVTLHPGACEPVQVVLRDSFKSAPAPAPYDVVASLTWTGSPYPAFTDAACTQPTSTVTLPASASTANVYVRAPASGGSALAVSHVDFISAAAVALPVQ